MSNTFTGKHRAVVKKTEHGTPFISFELSVGGSIPGMKKADIGMILSKDTDYDEASNIARVINEKLVGLYITGF